MKRGKRTGEPTAAQAVSLATKEGLILVPAANQTGYKGVYRSCGGNGGIFEAKIRQDGQDISLGRFANMETAALAYARHVGTEVAAEEAAAAAEEVAAAELTAEEAVALAWEEGLVLMTAANGTNYKGVYRSGDRFQTQIGRGRRVPNLGYFCTAEAAALATVSSGSASHTAVGEACAAGAARGSLGGAALGGGEAHRGFGPFAGGVAGGSTSGLAAAAAGGGEQSCSDDSWRAATRACSARAAERSSFGARASGARSRCLVMRFSCASRATTAL